MSTLLDFSKMEEISISFGKRIKDLRLQKGYSQEKLAEIADLDRTYIPGIESGKRNVSLLVAKKIADAFGIMLSELLRDI